MKISFKLLALFLVILTSSCKKDFKEVQQNTIHLTKKAGWLTLKIEEKNAAGAWINITGNPSPFDVDNLLIFDPFFNWIIDEGPLKLPENRQVPFFGTWMFTDNGTKIQITDGNLMQITELSESKLVTIVTAGGVTRRYTYGHP